MEKPWVYNQDEALEYARNYPNREIGEALEFAIGLAVVTLLADEKEYYLEQCLPDRKPDLLLYVKLLSHLLQRHERLNRILGGDFSDDWLPPELEAKVRRQM